MSERLNPIEAEFRETTKIIHEIINFAKRIIDETLLNANFKDQLQISLGSLARIIKNRSTTRYTPPVIKLNLQRFLKISEDQDFVSRELLMEHFGEATIKKDRIEHAQKLEQEPTSENIKKISIKILQLFPQNQNLSVDSIYKLLANNKISLSTPTIRKCLNHLKAQGKLGSFKNKRQKVGYGTRPMIELWFVIEPDVQIKTN